MFSMLLWTAKDR
jgi:hypothetical protein